MRKQIRRHGKLIQKKTRKLIDSTDIRQRNATLGQFRIIATRIDFSQVWVVGEYATLREAKNIVDNSSSIGVNYYIHSDSSRVLYTKKGVVDA